MAITSVCNKRVFNRVNLEVNVELEYQDGRTQRCTTRDVGKGGAYVVMPISDFPALGELVAIKSIEESFVADLNINESAVVVHKGEDGIGLGFVDLSMFKDVN
ncbi:MAG: PilZ domain-containing protein [Gammaproteobacteria bacterium]|nr:PilZ domain-containing protein [Gammaproteobacteria bacterium]